LRLFKTGDFGRIKNGLLHFEGRRDTQLKVRGHRIDITEIEKCLNDLDTVAKSVTLVHRATEDDRAIASFVVLQPKIAKTPQEIENQLRSFLTKQMIPQVLILDELPYLANGKVDRQKLLETFDSHKIANRKEIDIQGVEEKFLPMAAEVFQIIAKSLGNELRYKVHAHANFYELGGNTLNTIEAIAQLKERGFSIRLLDFVNAHNLAEVLRKITTTKSRSSVTSVGSMTDMKLRVELISVDEKEECIDLIAKYFYHEGDIERFVEDVSVEKYRENIGELWTILLESGLSFSVRNEHDEMVGVSLSFDVTLGPLTQHMTQTNPVVRIMNFIASVEKPIM
jgi:hypothetical protein